MQKARHLLSRCAGKPDHEDGIAAKDAAGETRELDQRALSDCVHIDFLHLDVPG